MSLVMLYLVAVGSIYGLNAHRLIFKWYDGWVGYFWDSKKCLLYLFLIPYVGLKINCKPVKRFYLERWKYRKYDDELCCCGEQMGHGGSICYHGGCRSMKEYVVTCEMEDQP